MKGLSKAQSKGTTKGPTNASKVTNKTVKNPRKVPPGKKTPTSKPVSQYEKLSSFPSLDLAKTPKIPRKVQPTENSSNSKWPESLREFVERSFLKAKSLDPASEPEFTRQLQHLVIQAGNENKVWTNPWHLQKLPIFDPSVPLKLVQDHQSYLTSAVPVPEHLIPNNKEDRRAKESRVGKIVKEYGKDKPRVAEIPWEVTIDPSPTYSGSQIGNTYYQQNTQKTMGSYGPTTSFDADIRPNGRLEIRSNIRPVESDFDSSLRKKQRSNRFSLPSRESNPPPDPSKEIVGTLQALEKRYLRLTSAPDPAMVRPAHMLEKCLEYVVNKYRTENKLYLYINDQLKAIRQDLTVQHITNDLAVRVYETHGRIAIENDDLGEFNQCQSQLMHLYVKPSPYPFSRTHEFTCYRVLYLLLTGNYAGIAQVSLKLSESGMKNEDESQFSLPFESIQKVMELLSCVVQNSHFGFFQIFKWFRKMITLDVLSICLISLWPQSNGSCRSILYAHHLKSYQPVIYPCNWLLNLKIHLWSF